MVDRRRFLQGCVGVSALGLMGVPGLGQARSRGQQERVLALHNLHTEESIQTVYWAEGGYVPEGLAQLNHVLRDHRCDEACAMDPSLFDLLFLLHGAVDGRRPYGVISGYRSPATNAHLRSRSNGVAKQSLHMQGKAIDIRLPGCELHQLQRAAKAMGVGGVGLYSQAEFLHLDTGRVRYWGV